MASPEPDAVFTGTIRESPVTDRYVVDVPHDVNDALEAGGSYTIAVFAADAPLEGDQSFSTDEGGSDSGQRPPVKVGELIDVTIESLGGEGDGVAKVAGGYTVFVPGGEVGDELTVEIETVKDRFAFGELRARARERSD